jgi:hypothetical protein
MRSKLILGVSMRAGFSAPAAIIVITVGLLASGSVVAQQPKDRGRSRSLHYIDPLNLRLGDRGAFEYRLGEHRTYVALEVLQVLGPDRMRVRPIVGIDEGRWAENSVTGEIDFIVQGVSTTGIVDKQIIDGGGQFQVTKTETYQSVMGADRTVFVVEPYPSREQRAAVEHEKELRQIRENAEKRRLDERRLEALPQLKLSVATTKGLDSAPHWFSVSISNPTDVAFERLIVDVFAVNKPVKRLTFTRLPANGRRALTFKLPDGVVPTKATIAPDLAASQPGMEKTTPQGAVRKK